MHDDVPILQAVVIAQELYIKWSSKWFWRRRFAGFLDKRIAVRDRVRQRLTRGDPGYLRYFGLLSDSRPISLDMFVLQVMALRELGYDFDLDMNFHPRETEWISDGGKRDSWEKFEDCHTEVEKSPAWYAIRLTVAVEAPVSQ